MPSNRNAHLQNQPTKYTRDVSWVGGNYVEAAIGLLTYDQMYVEKLVQLGGVKKPYPLVLFHGGGTSGVVSSTLLRENIKANIPLDLAKHIR